MLAVDRAEVERYTVALIDAGPDEAAVVRELCSIAKQLGLRSSVVDAAPGRPNARIVLPGTSSGGLLFLGHSDVVPAGQGWTGDPFTARVAGGRITGRGACDMKGGIAAVLGAMSACLRAGVTPEHDVTLAVVVDEEDDGLGIRSWVQESMVQQSRLQDGHVTYSGCIVAEPTGAVVIVGCRGATNLDVTVTGRSAHAGRPEDGRSAVAAAARIVGDIMDQHSELAADPHPLLGAGSWNPGRIDGGTGPSIVAGSCTVQLDRRLLPGESAERVADDLLARLRTVTDLDVDVAIRMEMPGFLTDEQHPLVTSAIGALHASGVDDVRTGVWTASCDGGFVARDLGVPTVVLGPGDLPGQAHQPDESIAVDEIVSVADAYALMMAGR